jgi:hypothetical protein
MLCMRRFEGSASVRSWHHPEAFESENKFRLLRCCGQDLLGSGSSLRTRANSTA